MSAAHRPLFPTADEIAARAHELFLSGGRRVAMIPAYWRAAERELRQRAADRWAEIHRHVDGERVRYLRRGRPIAAARSRR